jgi:hypothetical protein
MVNVLTYQKVEDRNPNMLLALSQLKYPISYYNTLRTAVTKRAKL